MAHRSRFCEMLRDFKSLLTRLSRPDMALIRNALLAVLAEHFPDEPSPDLLETIGTQIGQNITMLGS